MVEPISKPILNFLSFFLTIFDYILSKKVVKCQLVCSGAFNKYIIFQKIFSLNKFRLVSLGIYGILVVAYAKFNFEGGELHAIFPKIHNCCAHHLHTTHFYILLSRTKKRGCTPSFFLWHNIPFFLTSFRSL